LRETRTNDPQLCILYLLAFLDRTNIGNAKVDGLQKSLHNMSTGRYNAALTMFFISYSIFEPLTNVLLKRLRPSIFIPIIMYERTSNSSNWQKLTNLQDYLGCLHDFHGIRRKLVRSDDSSLVLGNGRSGPVSGRQLFPLLLVQAIGVWRSSSKYPQNPA
jgi:hypothetical protein